MTDDPFDLLSPNQIECLRQTRDGRTSKEIAQSMGLSYQTVDQYLSRAAATLKASSRREAARLLDARPEVRFNKPEFRLEELDPPSSFEQLEASDDKRHGLGAWLQDHPIGGRENRLGTSERVRMIGTIALVAFLLVIALAIVAKAGMWMLSPR